ncbi:hypothetical protein S245_063461, partial [Arachis hypogaea]
RIALAYLVVAMVEIFSKSAQPRDPELAPTQFSIFKSYYWHWVVAACILTIYLALLMEIMFQIGVSLSIIQIAYIMEQLLLPREIRSPCNAAGYIDREVLRINHMYKHPAWKRSQACTEKSPFEGPFRKNAPSWCYAPFEPEGILRLKHWILLGLSLLTSGLILHFTHAIPLNKQLYTLSYVCVTSGAAALAFSAFYTMGIFAGFINGWYYDHPHNTL